MQHLLHVIAVTLQVTAVTLHATAVTLHVTAVTLHVTVVKLHVTAVTLHVTAVTARYSSNTARYSSNNAHYCSNTARYYSNIAVVIKVTYLKNKQVDNCIHMFLDMWLYSTVLCIIIIMLCNYSFIYHFDIVLSTFVFVPCGNAAWL